ncbi:hypothetical protein [Mucilaginibacter sp.]|uniref:hypothetical protein n=1 Tax=Mucilaginibacter sp. TaxID=1882438 RepID=UPI003D111A6D
MDISIKNVDDLRGEILRLKGIEQEQSIALGERFKNLSAVFSTFYSLFPKSGNKGGEASKGFFEQDIFGLVSRIVLPFTLNKTLFRHSNFLIKTLVSVASQRASRFISEDTVIGLWDKAKTLFAKKEKAHINPEHKSIPPLSETA